MTDLSRLELLRGQRSDSCVSDYALDCLLTGATDENNADTVRNHVEGCARCTERLEQLRSEREEFAKRPIPIDLARSRSSRRTRAAVAMLVAAAAAIFLVQRPIEEDGVIRTKGTAWFGYTVVAPGGTVRGDQDTAVASPGDELQWTVRVGAPRYVAVLSRDPVGVASVYFPEGEIAARVEPRGGQMQILPLAARLDDKVGEEQIYGLICEGPVSLGPVVAKLNSGEVSFPSDCTVVKRGLLKKERP